MKNMKNIRIILTNPAGVIRTIVPVTIDPSMTNDRATHSDPDLSGNVVTILNASTNSAYEITVRQNSADSNYLNTFVDVMEATGLEGAGIFKNNTTAGFPETHIMNGVTIMKKASGTHDSSNTDVSFTLQSTSTSYLLV